MVFRFLPNRQSEGRLEISVLPIPLLSFLFDLGFSIDSSIKSIPESESKNRNWNREYTDGDRGKTYNDNISESFKYSNWSSFDNGADAILQDYCILPQLDPWDPSIMPFFSPRPDPALTCKPRVEQISKLIEGQLFIFTTDLICRQRCLLPKDDYNLVFGEWSFVENGTRPRCDVIEVECRRPKAEEAIYKFLHAQTFRLQRVISENVDRFTESVLQATIKFSRIPRKIRCTFNSFGFRF